MDEFSMAVALFLCFTAAVCLTRLFAAPERARRLQNGVLLGGNLSALAAVVSVATGSVAAIDLTLVMLMLAALASVVWPRPQRAGGRQ